MKTILLATLLFCSLPDTARSQERKAPVRLGDCEPKATNGSEEDRARKEAERAGLSDEEVLARLIYAEALSTGYWKNRCQAPSEEDLFESIGWGVMNRVAKIRARGAMYDTVFARNQFRTSFSAKRSNPYAAIFLCPDISKNYLKGSARGSSADSLYERARDTAESIASRYRESGLPERYKGITNFFYPQSAHFGDLRPPWAPNQNPARNRGYLPLLMSDKPCVEFYSL